MQDQMEQHDIRIGRDKFYELLRRNNLLIIKRKRRPMTTNSNHPLRKYDDLVKGYEPVVAHQVWVSDITYIRVQNEWNYVAFITDAYSRKVVGFNVNDRMDAAFCVQALQQALAQLPEQHQLIHHSDRGLQYCSKAYTDILTARGIRISMTQTSDPRDNAIAERVNGIFKDEFEMNRTFDSLEQARSEIARMVETYNEQRPHGSCDNLTPKVAHHKQGVLDKTWTSRTKKQPLPIKMHTPKTSVNLIQDSSLHCQPSSVI